MNFNYGNLRTLNNMNNMNNMAGMNTWNDPAQQLGFVGVQNENEARAFPVGLGNSVTFRDESQPNTFYTKTMGNSPLDRPIFEKYRLVKEETATFMQDAPETAQNTKDIDLSIYALKTEIEPILTMLSDMKKEISILKKKKIMREVEVDDE